MSKIRREMKQKPRNLTLKNRKDNHAESQPSGGFRWPRLPEKPDFCEHGTPKEIGCGMCEYLPKSKDSKK